jgi:hypothetical protein
MLSVTYAECHMRKPHMLNVIMLNAVILRVITLSVFMLSVVAPTNNTTIEVLAPLSQQEDVKMNVLSLGNVLTVSAHFALCNL